MKNHPWIKQLTSFFVAIGLMFSAQMAFANGEIGEHVNHLSDNIEKYEEEVEWVIKKVGGIVERYEAEGVKAANSGAVVDYWEAVQFHAAIESNYIQLYAEIWQGLYGVKEAVDNQQSVADVRQQYRQLKHTLWQSLGAVKLAAVYQDKGLLETVQLREGAPSNSVEILEAVKNRLHKAVAKFAEKAYDESSSIVHDAYLNLFEGVEGELITLNAELVEDLEKDFNVVIPKTIKSKASLDELRDAVATMESKLNQAIKLVKNNSKKKDVF